MTEIINAQKFTDEQLEEIITAVKEEQKRRKDATLAGLQENAIRALQEYFDAGGELHADGETLCDWSSEIMTYGFDVIEI